MPKTRSSATPLFTLASFVVVIAALVFAKDVLLPVALAVLLSFVLTPIASRIERWGIGRILSVTVTVGISVALLGGMAWLATTQLVELGRNLPASKIEQNILAKVKSISPSSKTLSRLTTAYTEMSRAIANGGLPTKGELHTKDDGRDTDEKGADSENRSSSEAQSSLTEHRQAESNEPEKKDQAVPVKVVEMPPSPLSAVQNLLGPLVSPLTTVGMVVVLVVFMLMQREDQRNRLIRLFGSANLHPTTEALNDISTRISRYLRMQFMINAGYGCFVALGLWILGVPSAPLWGVLGFVLRFLPYIGPWLAAALPIAVSLAVSTGWSQPVLVIAWYATLELIAGNVVEPWLYGHSVGVSGLGVILAAIFWTWIWGPIGLVLAVPLTVCLVVTAQYIPQLRFIAVLLGDQPTLSLDERVYQRLLAFDDVEPRKLAKQYLETATLEKFYDDVLIPVLAMAERDRAEELLSGEQEEFVEDAVEELIEMLGATLREPEVAAAVSADAPTETVPAARILCIPLRDRADRTGTLMLAQLLAAEGFHVDIGSSESLATEVVDQVSTLQSDAVVISMLPPVAPRQTRLLWRRLRTRYPQLPIVIGCWKAGNDGNLFRQFGVDHDSHVVTTLADAMAAVRAGMGRLRVAQLRETGS
jgi:predicted PurR-regulated permease PerM/methylmalonyl-CoA mutase cobalamin-binding subunit